MKLSQREVVILRDCLSIDIVERERQIQSGFTTETLDHPIIKERKELRKRMTRYIDKFNY